MAAFERCVVLIADDEPMVLQLATRSLARHGYEVIPATDGMAAYHAAENRDAVVHLLPLQNAMHVALASKQVSGKVIVGDLGLLKAKNVRLLLAEQAFDDAEPGSDRVHVPGCDLDGLGHASRLAPSVFEAKKRPSLRGHGTRADQAFVTQGDQAGRG
jgi:CheY-like chemotaxis protein